MSEYPFRFEKAPKKKGTCPQCGQHDKFRYYEDLNGNRLEDFGKCERTNTCGYWLVPTGKAISKAEGTYTPPPQPVQIYPNSDLLNRLTDSLGRADSNFHTYCLSIGISFEHLAKWRIGAETSKGKALTVFIHEDGQKQIVNAKYFHYTTGGKRDKDFDSFSLKQPADKELKRYGMCLFGEHLLDPDRKRPVMIVESEKSAVIASWFYKEYDWIAVGSANGLTDAKIQVLVGRWVYWLADADGNVEIKEARSGKTRITEGGRKNSSIRKLEAYKMRFAVIDLFPKRTDGYDIADAIHDGQTPELVSPQQLELLANQTDALSTDPSSINAVVQADDDDYWESQVGLPIPVWGLKATRKHYRQYGFVEHENCYYFATKRESDDVLQFKPISNFIVTPLLLIESKSDPKRIYQITNSYGVKRVIDLDPKQFSAVAGFSEIVMSKGNFIFYGGKTHFIKITMKLFEESKEAQEIKTLGYHPDGFYAFSNGIQNSKWIPLDENGYGIVEHEGRQYFLPAMSKIYNSDDQEYQNQKLFLYKQGSTQFTDYAKQYCDVYSLNNNGQIGLLYYITSLFRDVVFSRFRFFPHIFLFGPPQSGKSTLAWSAMYMFGEPRTPFMLNTGTSVAFYKQFAEFRNSIVWFDEYKNTIDPGRVQSLKTAYDGAGHTKSDNTKDNRNKSIPVLSGCIISGQELPTADAALFTRCILLQVTKTDFSSEEREKQERFKKEVELNGVSHLTAYLSQFRSLFIERFEECYDAEFVQIKKHFEKRGIDDRITKNMAIVLATFQALKDRLTFPFDEKQVRQTAFSIIEAQNNLIGSSKETSQFWNAMMSMLRQGLVKDRTDFRIETRRSIKLCQNRSKDPVEKDLTYDDQPSGRRVLFMKLAHIHNLYEVYCKQRGQKSLDQGSMRHYLHSSKEFLGNADNVKYFGGNTTALAFDYEMLTESVNDFDLEQITYVDPVDSPFQ